MARSARYRASTDRPRKFSPQLGLNASQTAGWRRLGFCAQSLSMTGRWLSDLASEGDLRIQAVVLEELGDAGSCGVEHVVVESVVHQ